MDVVQLLELIQTLMDVVLSSTSILLHFAYIHSYNCIYGVPLFRTLPPCILHVEAWPAAIHNPELSDVSCPLVATMQFAIEVFHLLSTFALINDSCHLY